MKLKRIYMPELEQEYGLNNLIAHTPENAYRLGFLWADGWLQKVGRLFCFA